VNFKTGHTRGDKLSRTYSSWLAMKQRCSNPRNASYTFYGARGIKVCARWLGKHGFENFLSDMGERPPGKTLERRKNDEDYSPENCRWATAAEQMQNTKTTKLTVDSARKIRELAALGFWHRVIADLFGVSKSVVAHVIKLRSWRTP
jgi:hypothetical protein